MAVETSPNPRNTRKSAAGKSASAKSDKVSQTGSAGKRTPGAALIDPQRRRELIAEAAYFRAERRGFEPGCEAEDWLAAELEIDRALAIGVSPPFNPAVQ